MQKIEFKQSKDFTVGVELEIQLIDPSTFDLTQATSRILKVLNKNPNFKHELYESVIEINSNPCKNIQELEKDLISHVRELHKAATNLGIKITMAGTHPAASWSKQVLSPNKRYLDLVEKIQMPLRRMLTYGIHVHVGLNNGSEAVAVNNGIMNYLPHLLAVSCSSPYWVKRDSGMESYRVKVFETLPATGLPFRLDNWESFCELFFALKKAGSIESIREIWWDSRPHPDYGTVEVRICDAVPILSEVISIAALIQSLVASLAERYRENNSLIPLPSFIIRQNKWRAARYGLDCRLITDKSGNTKPVKELVSNLIQELKPISKNLGSEIQLEGINNILNTGTSSKRQRVVFEKTKGDWNAIVNSLINEFEESWQLKRVNASG